VSKKNSGNLDKDLELLLEIPSKHLMTYEATLGHLINLAPEGIMLNGLIVGNSTLKTVIAQLAEKEEKNGRIS